VNKTLTVSQVNKYVKALVTRDPLLADLEIEGELSNFKFYNSKHLYFTLKDSACALSCVMFANNAINIKFSPKNGDKVIITGYVSLYEKTGQYQLYCTNMKPTGVGDLALAFVRLRDTLKNEGLFDVIRKRPIPKEPACIALVTSPTGAVIQDMLKIIRNRNHIVKVIVVPVLVQGEQAPADIVKALTLLNRQKVNSDIRPDVIILARGGGSMEDLKAFNEESVARAVGESHIPLISAIGHESDFTITDFVADLRAATPSVAAALAAPDVAKQLRDAKTLTQQLHQAMDNRLNSYRTTISHHKKLLESLSPYKLWQRGYAAIYNENNQEIRSATQLQTDKNVVFHLQDGIAKAQIISIKLHDAPQ